MSLDEHHLLDSDGNILDCTQNQFIAHGNTEGIIIASVADVYRAGKADNEDLIQSLGVDFDEDYIVTSTRIDYNADDLDALVTHYFGSTVATPIQTNLKIADYSSGITLNKLLKSKRGLHFMQTLINANDDAKEIERVWKNVTGKSATETNIWTPNQESRESYSTRAVFLCCNYDEFHINWNDYVNDDGRSRGVKSIPEGDVAKNYETNTLPYDLESGIIKKSKSVYFSNVQQIGKHTKYAGMFCYDQNRFVLSITLPETDTKGWDKELSFILAENVSSKEKMSVIYQKFNPLYAHLLKHELKDSEYKVVDDIEVFGKSRLLK